MARSSCFSQSGPGAAPAIFGWSQDVTGSYALILYSTAGLFVIGALLMLVLGKYPEFGPAKATAETA